MPDEPPPVDLPPGTTRRWWPTIEMLDAGVALLLAEWQPVGLSPAEIPREELEEFTFHFFGPLLAPRPNLSPVAHVTAMIASAERDRLRLAPSSESHRQRLAERLRDIAERLPLPNVVIPHASAVVVMSGGDEGRPRALDPEGECSRCGARGTVALVTEGANPRRFTRFCRACWKEVRHDYMDDPGPGPHRPPTTRERIALMDRAGEPPRSIESRSWDDAIDFIRMVLSVRSDPKYHVTAAGLADMAQAILSERHRMDGPMPDEVESFVRQFGAAQ